MKKQIIFTILTLISSNVFAQFDFRAWQILSLDTAYSKRVLEKTEEMIMMILPKDFISKCIWVYLQKAI